MIKGELAVLNKQNKVATYTNKIINKLLAGTSFLLVAVGVAELAVFGNNEIFAGNLSVFGWVFGFFFTVGLGLIVWAVHDTRECERKGKQILHWIQIACNRRCRK